MAINQAVLVEAGGGMEFLLQLTLEFQGFDHGSDVQVRQAPGGFVEVNDRDYITRRSLAASQEYPIVVGSILIPGQAAKVVFRP